MESQTPLTISAEYGLIDQNKFFGKRIAAKDLSNYYLIQKGEFAYNKSTSNDAPWGAIKRLDCYNNGALSTLYIVFKIKDNKSCYSDFLVTYYGTSLWHKGVKEIATEGARNHGLLNVSPSDFFRTKLVIPQDFEEQRKIGAFFTQLDNTITLQQRKLNSLQKLKKGLLQKMFPKKGENIPEIRFPKFSDAWKQLKLSSYLDVSSEKNVDNFFSKDDVLSVSGDYGVVNQIEFQGRSFAGTSVSNYGVVHTGNVIYTKSPLKANPYGIIKTNKGESGIVSTLYAVYSVKENSFPNFIQDYFELNSRLNNYLRPLVNKGSKNDMKVSNENALKGLVIFPGLEEQRKISTFLAQLNNTITLQQRKLESLQKLKKGLLQQMFI